MSLHSCRHLHLVHACKSNSFWLIINVPTGTVLSYGIWTALLRLFIKVHTKLEQLIGRAREWPGSTQLTLWLVLIEGLWAVSNLNLFPLKCSVQGAKLFQGSGETAVGVREEKCYHTAIRVQSNVFSDEWMKNNQDSLGSLLHVSFHWAARTHSQMVQNPLNTLFFCTSPPKWANIFYSLPLLHSEPFFSQ